MEESAIFWCKDCNVPSFEETCPVCGNRGSRIASDIRPVFPEERLLIELILGVPLKYKNSSVWNVSSGVYIIDGDRVTFPISRIKELDISSIRLEL